VFQVKRILVGRRTSRKRAKWNEQVGLGILYTTTITTPVRALLSRRQRLQKKKNLIGGVRLYSSFGLLYENNDIIIIVRKHDTVPSRGPPTGIELLEGGIKTDSTKLDGTCST